MASPEDGEDFCCGFSVEEGEEERPGRDERARLIQMLEDEMTRETSASARTRLEESPRPRLNLEDEPPTQVWYFKYPDLCYFNDFLLNRSTKGSPVLSPRVRKKQTQVLARELVPGRRWNSWINIPAKLFLTPSCLKRIQSCWVWLLTFKFKRMRKGPKIPTAKLSWRTQVSRLQQRRSVSY